ncbi:hypothetical protein FE257_005327, partial [Aspergillus nanangensis]
RPYAGTLDGSGRVLPARRAQTDGLRAPSHRPRAGCVKMVTRLGNFTRVTTLLCAIALLSAITLLSGAIALAGAVALAGAIALSGAIALLSVVALSDAIPWGSLLGPSSNVRAGVFTTQTGKIRSRTWSYSVLPEEL